MTLHTLCRVALVGRPNVGKSTLFNRLAGKRLALVDNTPGVTRDWREAPAHLGDLEFVVMDTAGLEDYATTNELTQAMEAQTKSAMERSHVILFMVDAQTGLTPIDRDLAIKLRKTGKSVQVVVNKCDSAQDPRVVSCLYDAASLGLGDPIPMAAEHKEGMVELYQALKPYVDAITLPEYSILKQEHRKGRRGKKSSEDPLSAAADPDIIQDTSTQTSPLQTGPIQIAIVGRPNVGKSTLINRLIGEERLLACDIPGVTRDAITIDWIYDDIHLQLIDTAGIRRRAKVSEKLEKLSVRDSERAIQFAQIVVLVVDATQALEKQDLTIARHVVEEGRALIIACNKSDLLTDRNKYATELRHTLNTHLAQVRDIPLVMLSAIKDKGFKSLMKAVFEIYGLWNTRLSTGPLNRWLKFALSHHPTPMVGNSRISIKYITQIKARPPTFALFANKSEELPDSYVRYLVGSIREAFNLKGVPIRLFVRGQKNPYVGEG